MPDLVYCSHLPTATPPPSLRCPRVIPPPVSKCLSRDERHAWGKDQAPDQSHSTSFREIGGTNEVHSNGAEPIPAKLYLSQWCFKPSCLPEELVKDGRLIRSRYWVGGILTF